MRTTKMCKSWFTVDDIITEKYSPKRKKQEKSAYLWAEKNIFYSFTTLARQLLYIMAEQ